LNVLRRCFARVSSIRAAAIALAFLLPVTARSHQANDTPTPASRTPAVRKPAKGVSNFGQVTPTLYRGALPSPRGLETLQEMGINVVVDLRASMNRVEKASVERLGMSYVSIPSYCEFPKDRPLAEFLRVVQENPGKKVFVHCRLGEDRTGMAVAAYRMADEGWSADEAMREMRKFGFSEFHHAMCPGMSQYERKFPTRLKTSPAFRAVTAPEQGASR
jgi:tyrosine-protein phosphatase SIW14